MQRGGARGGQAGGDAPAPGCHPEVLEVRDVLWEHHDQLYMTFFYYASQENKPNVFMINYLIRINSRKINNFSN